MDERADVPKNVTYVQCVWTAGCEFGRMTVQARASHGVRWKGVTLTIISNRHGIGLQNYHRASQVSNADRGLDEAQRGAGRADRELTHQSECHVQEVQHGRTFAACGRGPGTRVT